MQLLKVHPRADLLGLLGVDLGLGLPLLRFLPPLLLPKTPPPSCLAAQSWRRSSSRIFCRLCSAHLFKNICNAAHSPGTYLPLVKLFSVILGHYCFQTEPGKCLQCILFFLLLVFVVLLLSMVNTMILSQYFHRSPEWVYLSTCLSILLLVAFSAYSFVFLTYSAYSNVSLPPNLFFT